MKTIATRGRALPALSRGARTARGALVSLVATITAGASHALAGGDVTWLSMVATAILALPLAVALTGRRAAPWRLAVTVGASQFVYHWCFASLGEIGAQAATQPRLSPHALHLAQLSNFSSTIVAAPQNDLWMWLGHIAAGAVTLALLMRGERALTAVMQLIRRVVLAPLFTLAPRTKVAAAPRAAAPALHLERALIASVSRRGPPLHA